MQFLCVGYPKTGSKSCSSALRKLGYNVADFVETSEFLSSVWLDYLEDRASITDVLDAYKKHGFDSNQDLPGNIHWEELYRAMPKDTKVILTVRDNVDQWWRSWCGFMAQECKRDSIGDFCTQSIFNIMTLRGWTGPEMQAMMKVAQIVMAEEFDPSFKQNKFSVEESIQIFTKKEMRLKAAYVKHNLYVQSIVPPENLLVWNVKDGWEPLCKFMGKPIPEGPIPHDNKTGDEKFLNDYFFDSGAGKLIFGHLKWNMAVLGVQIAVVSFISYKEWKSEGAWTKSIVAPLASKLANRFSF